MGGSGYQDRPELVCALQTIECKIHELRHKPDFKRRRDFSMMCSISECRCGAFVVSLPVDNYLSVKAPMVSVRKTQFEAQQQSKCVFPCDLTRGRAIIRLNSLIDPSITISSSARVLPSVRLISTHIPACTPHIQSYDSLQIRPHVI